MSSRRSTLLGLQKINSSRINSDYVDHHKTREGNTVIYTLPSDENVVDVLLVSPNLQLLLVLHVRATLSLLHVDLCSRHLLCCHHRRFDLVGLWLGPVSTRNRT